MVVGGGGGGGGAILLSLFLFVILVVQNCIEKINKLAILIDIYIYVDFKKWQCRMSLSLKIPLVPCRL